MINNMKTLIFRCTLIVLLITSACTSLEEETTLLNIPTNEARLTVANEIYTVDFRFDIICNQLKIFEVLPDEFAKLKTRDELINYYKTLMPGFLPSYSSMWPDNKERIFARVEYMLAQECFSEQCDSRTRKEVLQLAANYQKAKWSDYELDRYINPYCAQKTGIFLMAVILVKERNSSSEFIDEKTLQQALLCLNSDDYISKDFSDLIIESSEKFLSQTTKNNQL